MRHLEALREDSKMRRFERDDAKSQQILAEKRLQEHQEKLEQLNDDNQRLHDKIRKVQESGSGD